MRDALDAAWGDFPTEDVGYDWLRYTGNARPSAQWVWAVARHSRVTFIQETVSERSQQGFQAGVYDCQFAESRARAVHPGVESIAVCVSDGNYADRWDASEYGRGWASVATLHFFPYGTPAICASFCSGAHSYLCLMGDWVPQTWGSTVAPMQRLLTQVVGFTPVPNTDLNTVYAPYYPGSAPAPPSTPPRKKVPVPWLAFIRSLNWIDVWYEGVIVDGFPNDIFQGGKTDGYLNAGCVLTTYETEADYAPVRKKLEYATGVIDKDGKPTFP